MSDDISGYLVMSGKGGRIRVRAGYVMSDVKVVVPNPRPGEEVLVPPQSDDMLVRVRFDK